jgi:predicted transcriptional regulator
MARKTQITFGATPEMVANLDRIAKRLKRTRSNTVVVLLEHVMTGGEPQGTAEDIGDLEGTL